VWRPGRGLRSHGDVLGAARFRRPQVAMRGSGTPDRGRRPPARGLTATPGEQ